MCNIRAALGKLFTWKAFLLLTVVLGSIFFYRPFCKWICPLGAFYALMNKVSLLGIQVDHCKCVSCGKCAKVCQMDVDVTRTPDHAECIRCGKCVGACPVNALTMVAQEGELAQQDKFDYVVVNDTVERAVNELHEILNKRR